MKKLSICITFALIAGTSLADTLELTDGRTLEGTLVGVSNGIVMFETSEGVQAFPQDQVSGMSTGAAAAPAPAAEVQPAPAGKQGVTVPAGTRMVIRMVDTVDTSQHSAGHRFRGQLEGALAVNGETVVPRGTFVHGTIVAAQQSRRASGRSELAMTFTDLMIDDQLVPIATEGLAAQGQSEGGRTVGRTARAAAIGGLIDGSDGARTGAKVGLGASILTRGSSINVPAGTMLETTLRVPLDL